MPLLVVHFGPCREEVGHETRASARSLHTPHAAGPAGGGSAGAAGAGIPHGEAGDIVEALIRVVDHPQGRRVGSPNAQGGSRPGGCKALGGGFISETVVTFG